MKNIIISCFIFNASIFTSNCFGEDVPVYYFKFPLEKSGKDGTLTIVKNERDKQEKVEPTKKQLIQLISTNPILADAFYNKFGTIGTNFLKTMDSDSKIHYSDLGLYKAINDFKLTFALVQNNQIPQCKGTNNIIESSEINIWSEPATEDYKVPAGEHRIILAGSILHYKTFSIEDGASVTINDGRQKITFIKADGDCNINGGLISRKFRSGSGPFKETSPDGEVLEANIQESNKGGKGGKGGDGFYTSCVGVPSVIGGQGEFGVPDNGGGGGGGSRMTIVNLRRCSGLQGSNASGQRGGISAASNANGGDGGGRTPKRNGGYLYLKCLGKISFKNAKVDFSGEQGMPGQNGNLLGGGGGGGGPGGQGGILFLNKPPVDDLRNANFAGGFGGNKGLGGKNEPNNRYPTGSPGQDGQGGESGFNGAPELVDN